MSFDMPTGDFKTRGGWLVRVLMKEFDLTDYQAAGIVGNLGFESGGLTELQEIAPLAGGRGGYGWAQWTGPRRVNFENYAQAYHLKASSDEANYRFLVYELSGSYSSTISSLKKTGGLGAAVFSVGQTYERPGGTTANYLPGYDGRLAYAQKALDGFRATVTPENSGPLPEHDPVELCRQMQGVLGVVADGWPGADTYKAMQKWRREHQ